MKIETSKQLGIEFSTLDAGDVFTASGVAYMRVGPTSASNAVKLDDGSLTLFDRHVLVRTHPVAVLRLDG